MEDLIGLINHLINAKYSIDGIESICNRLNRESEQIFRILRADRYKDYFQLIKNKNQGTEKIALTLDVSFPPDRNPSNLSLQFSSSVVHIMHSNVKINPARFCTYALTISDLCMANVRIKAVHTIMKC